MRPGVCADGPEARTSDRARRSADHLMARGLLWVVESGRGVRPGRARALPSGGERPILPAGRDAHGEYILSNLLMAQESCGREMRYSCPYDPLFIGTDRI